MIVKIWRRNLSLYVNNLKFDTKWDNLFPNPFLPSQLPVNYANSCKQRKISSWKFLNKLLVHNSESTQNQAESFSIVLFIQRNVKATKLWSSLLRNIQNMILFILFYFLHHDLSILKVDGLINEISYF
jgi:hypothetical protein